MSILLLSGDSDVQITKPMVDHLMTGLATNDKARHVALPNTNHVMRVIPAGSSNIADYANPSCPFSTIGDQAITAWLQANL